MKNHKKCSMCSISCYVTVISPLKYMNDGLTHTRFIDNQILHCVSLNRLRSSCERQQELWKTIKQKKSYFRILLCGSRVLVMSRNNCSENKLMFTLIFVFYFQ